MMKLSGFRRLGLAFGLVFAVTAQTSRAGSIEIDLTISRGSDTVSFQIFAGSGTDAPGSTANDLSANLLLINSVVTPAFGVTFSSLGANSNNPGTTEARINQNALFTVAAGGTDPLMISAIAFQTDFQFPTGGMGSLVSSASGTFSNATPASVQSFQSWFDQGNTGSMGPDPLVTPSGILNFDYNDPVDLSHSGTAAITPISGVTSPYALVNQINLTVGVASTDTGVSYGGTTKLTVAAVPEPASVLMTLSAIPIVFGMARRFRRGVRTVA